MDLAKLSGLNSGKWKLVLAVLLLLALALMPPSAHAATITLTSDPDCVSRAADVIDCFARGSDNAMWHISWTASTWSVWESLGGGFLSGPSAASWGSSLAVPSLDVFAMGEDNALWHISWRGGAWSDWERLGASGLTSDPDCAAWLNPNGTPRIDCFARGTDNAMYHKTGLFPNEAANGGWSDWESLGGLFPNSGPSAVVTSGTPVGLGLEFYLSVYAVGQDNGLRDKFWYCVVSGGGCGDSGWADWYSLGGKFDLTSDPDCASPGGFIVDCFVRGADNAIWEGTGNGSPATWKSLGLPPGGVWNYGPTAVSRGGKSFDVFDVGPDNGLYHNFLNGNPASPCCGWEAVPMTVGQVATFTHILKTPPGATATTTSSTTSSSTNAVTATDWAVLSVALDPPNAQAGTSVMFTATMALLSSSVPLPQTVDVQCQLDGQSCGAGSITYPGPVGQPSTVHTQTPWVATPGTHTLTWSIATMNDPNPANNAMSITFTVQPSTSQSSSTTTTQPSATSTSQSSTQQVTVVQTQTVTQPPTSTNSQVTSQPGILDFLQQNSLLIVGALGLLVIALAIATMKRGKHGSQATPNQGHR